MTGRIVSFDETHIWPSLDGLALKYGTDKSSADHNYCPLYEKYLGVHRHEPLTLLELGIWKGASLRMWRDYFPNATIIGLDRNNVRFEPPVDVVTFQGDQCDAAVIAQAGSLYGPPNVIVDDASHISSKTIGSFKLLWPHLAQGGIYVIEDLQTSYDDRNYGVAEASPDPDWNRSTAMNFCKRLADDVNSSLFPAKYRFGLNVASVHFEPNICVITKAGQWTTGE